MKRVPTIICLLSLILWCSGCTEDEPGPDGPEDVQDITKSAEITPYGGNLQLTDESGNVVTVTFPPASLMDTATVTLTLLGKHRDLPIEERTVRAFQILPADLVLYLPATISVNYQSSISNIEEAALFHLHTDEWLTPLGEHTYAEGSGTLTATTWSLGEFAEGKMNIAQINSQISMLISSMGITWKSAVVGRTEDASSGCEEYKATWDEWAETAASFLKFFELRYLLGYYDDLPPGEGSFQEDLDKVCSNIIRQGVDAVLNLGEPADPCCSDYARTIETMMKAMTSCGSQGDTFDRLGERYDQMHGLCHTYLDITTEVNIESGGLLIMTTGEVIVTLQGTGNGEASVSGTGELVVSGSGDAGGQCTATISGQTFATVSGTRDPAYVYELTLDMNQVAMMTTVCPDLVMETPLVGGSSRAVTLGPGNGFSISETETIDEGTVHIQATLQNPYIPAPDPE